MVKGIKITSGPLPYPEEHRAANRLIIQLNSVLDKEHFEDMKNDPRFRAARAALPADQKARVDDMGRKVAARFPANPIAGG